ncbi:unnamed protein product [Nesidiocoris tenuis]|uniref:Uncharacterized protein n=1 Tax=Nesidiocoris tenuis TaxID=355587 RepID=A0A6H5GZS7_9HEMI|nr:unnamed protein product [Nesidiocoris tenuis]
MNDACHRKSVWGIRDHYNWIVPSVPERGRDQSAKRFEIVGSFRRGLSRAALVGGQGLPVSWREGEHSFFLESTSSLFKLG